MIERAPSNHEIQVEEQKGDELWLGSPEAGEHAHDATWVEPALRGRRLSIIGWVLAIAAIAWIGFAAWALYMQRLPLLLDIVLPLTLAGGPVLLLGMAWLVFGRSSRRETERFRTAIAEMTRESAALESILAIVTTKLDENRERLTAEAAKLMTLGDEASDRLGRVAHYLAKETATLDRKAEQLESAANAARVDVGVLLTDLPRAEEQARAVAEAMRQAGLTALGEAGQLESQLSALVARGQQADEVVGGTAQRLAAHLARIETSTAAAKAQLDETTGGMVEAVDAALERTADSIAAARSALDAQGQAMLAMIEQSRSAIEEAGEASGRSLARRLETVATQIEALAGQLAAQDQVSAMLTGRLAGELTELEERFVTLGTTGNANNERLVASVEAVRERVAALHNEAAQGDQRTAQLIERAQELGAAVTEVTRQLGQDLPQALQDVEKQAAGTRAAAEALAPIVEAVQVAATDAATQSAAAEASIQRQAGALDALVGALASHVASAEAQLRSLGEAAESADTAAGRLAQETGPQLVEALLRVREAAAQSAERAREAIAAVIPDAAAQLGTASDQAVREAIAATVAGQIGELSQLAERATETARAASERLTRQMLAIGEAAAAVEARIDDARREREEADHQGFARRVSMLIESLNSTAIDVAKILSNEVADSDWTAYLKGDRGAFTRRAVRLLGNDEAREIAQYYNMDAEFRDQVNRYVHDFEAMLRRVLAEREGHNLAVTLLSSDMGKLYVALAQAIERLRS